MDSLQPNCWKSTMFSSILKSFSFYFSSWLWNRGRGTCIVKRRNTIQEAHKKMTKTTIWFKSALNYDRHIVCPKAPPSNHQIRMIRSPYHWPTNWQIYVSQFMKMHNNCAESWPLKCFLRIRMWSDFCIYLSQVYIHSYLVSARS